MAATTEAIAEWGVTGSKEGMTGIVTDKEIRKGGRFAEHTNEQGQIVAVVHYDTEQTVAMTIMAAPSATFPEPHTSMTVDGVKYYIEDVTHVMTARDFQKFRVSLKRYLKCDTVTDKTGAPAKTSA